MIDYQLEDTVFIPFTTRAFATGIPTVLAGTPAIDIYEDATATPIITGETLVVDLNSVVGFNMITVTATAATGFNVGGHYTATIQAGTVGGVSVVGEVVGEFTIDNSAAAKDLANVTDGLGAIKTETAAILADVTGINGDAMRGTDDAAKATVMGTPGDFGSGTLTIAANLEDMADDGTAVFDRSTDSLQAIRDNTPANFSGLGITAGAIDDVTLVATTTTNTDMRGTDSVDTATMRGTDSAALASVATEARLAELDPANLPATTDATLVDTGTTLPAQITALNDISVTDILTTQMAQSFAADGVAPTLTQALFLIQQILGDFAISGTTLTVREIDGATTAATFTLDSATVPTSLTRAT